SNSNSNSSRLNNIHNVHKEDNKNTTTTNTTHISLPQRGTLGWRKLQALQQQCSIQEERQRFDITCEEERKMHLIIEEEFQDRLLLMTINTTNINNNNNNIQTPQKQQQQSQQQSQSQQFVWPSQTESSPYSTAGNSITPPQTTPIAKADNSHPNNNNNNSRSSRSPSYYIPHTPPMEIKEETSSEQEYTALYTSAQQQAREYEAKSAQLMAYIRQLSEELLSSVPTPTTLGSDDISTYSTGSQSTEARQQRWREKKEQRHHQQFWWMTMRRLHDVQANRAQLDREYMELSKHIRHLHTKMQGLSYNGKSQSTLHFPSFILNPDGRSVSQEMMREQQHQYHHQQTQYTLKALMAMMSSLYKKLKNTSINVLTMPLFSKGEFINFMHTLHHQPQQALKGLQLTLWFMIGSVKIILDDCTKIMMKIQRSVPITHMTPSNSLYFLLGTILRCCDTAFTNTVSLFYMSIGTSCLLYSLGTSAIGNAFHAGYDFTAEATTTALNTFLMFPFGCLLELSNVTSAATHRILTGSRQTAAYTFYFTTGAGAAAAGNMKRTIITSASLGKRVTSAAVQKTMRISHQLTVYPFYFTVGVGAAATGNVKRVILIAIKDVDRVATALGLGCMKRVLIIAVKDVEQITSTALNHMKESINTAICKAKQITPEAVQHMMRVSHQLTVYPFYFTIGIGVIAAGDVKKAVNGIVSDVKSVTSAAAHGTMAVSRQIAAHPLYFTVGVGIVAAGNVKRAVNTAVSDVKGVSVVSSVRRSADKVSVWCRVPWREIHSL
ncbi:uncharacterized protein TM35_000261450, partial [Trypanosoma theileri]